MKPFERLAEFTEDWGYFTQRDGLKPSLSRILFDVSRLPYRHLQFVIVTCSLLDPLPDWQPKTQLLIRAFGQADVDWVRQIDRPSEARLCALRLADGQKGLMAFSNGQAAGYAWGSMDLQTRLERVHPRLIPGDVLCTDSYTSPAFRGQGIQTALTLSRFHLFRDLGCRRAISYIEVHNHPSLKVWQGKLKGQTIGSIDFMRIGPWYKVRYR